MRKYVDPIGLATLFGFVTLAILLSPDRHRTALASRPTLWIYTAPLIDGKQKCGPCRILKRDFDAGQFRDFDVKWLETPDGYSSPCIYYRDARGDWKKHLGWGTGEFKKFITQYQRDASKS